MSLDPQLELLLRFLERLKPFAISWRLSPKGALLQRRGRMVAMVLVEGMRIAVSPKDGDDCSFDLEFGHEDEAVDFIQFLADQILYDTPGHPISEPLDVLA